MAYDATDRRADCLGVSVNPCICITTETGPLSGERIGVQVSNFDTSVCRTQDPYTSFSSAFTIAQNIIPVKYSSKST